MKNQRQNSQTARADGGHATDLSDSLRDAEARLLLAVEATGLGTWDYNLTTGKLLWSERCKAIFGLPPEAPIDYEIFLTLLHPEDRERTNAVVQATLDPEGGGTYDIQYRVVWPDNSVHWVAAKGRAFFEGDGDSRRATRFTGTALDITARKFAESELFAREELYRALTDAMPQLVWVTDAAGAHLYFNRRWYEYTGLSEEESTGFGFADALHPEDRERTLALWQRAWGAGEPYEVEYRFFSRPQQTYRWFLGRARPVRDEQGRITRWVGTCTDIEDQKRLEDESARISREREQMLEEISTPLVPVWRGVLVLPIIGSLDTARMQRATEAALGEVTRTGARACIIDITGARIIDSHAVANLGNLVGALKLIGAEAIITGVGAHAAQSLVTLGLDFGAMRTHRTLAEALAALLKTNQHKQEGSATSNGITQHTW